MKQTIFSHQALSPTDNCAEILQTETDDEHLHQTLEELQLSGHHIDAWLDQKEQEGQHEKAV